eukprot:TRINITY_DN143_c0_g2_i2.p1 TRINITY_DN143_c0_g2~~TRINITY_DN143_c0_g2_i2.p1  ORF type:complete len:566 (-),score=111.76 TRINITY_DN143_c0_g2_i2:30-1727(-)
MKLLSSLSPDDTQTTEKLVDDILDSNSGVGVDLLSLHHAIVGSTTCYGQFSLLELCAQQSLELSDPVRIAASVNCVIDTLVLAQLCGIVLMANAWTHRKEAHLAVEMSKQLRDRLIAQRDAAQHLDIVYTYPNLSPSCKRTTQRRGNTANISLCQDPEGALVAGVCYGPSTALTVVGFPFFDCPEHGAVVFASVISRGGALATFGGKLYAVAVTADGAGAVAVLAKPGAASSVAYHCRLPWAEDVGKRSGADCPTTALFANDRFLAASFGAPSHGSCSLAVTHNGSDWRELHDVPTNGCPVHIFATGPTTLHAVVASPVSSGNDEEDPVLSYSLIGLTVELSDAGAVASVRVDPAVPSRLLSQRARLASFGNFRGRLFAIDYTGAPSPPHPPQKKTATHVAAPELPTLPDVLSPTPSPIPPQPTSGSGWLWFGGSGDKSKPKRKSKRSTKTELRPHLLYGSASDPLSLVVRRRLLLTAQLRDTGLEPDRTDWTRERAGAAAIGGGGLFGLAAFCGFTDDLRLAVVCVSRPFEEGAPSHEEVSRREAHAQRMCTGLPTSKYTCATM